MEFSRILLHFIVVDGLDIFELGIELMLFFLVLDFELFVGVLVELEFISNFL